MNVVWNVRLLKLHNATLEMVVVPPDAMMPPTTIVLRLAEMAPSKSVKLVMVTAGRLAKTRIAVR